MQGRVEGSTRNKEEEEKEEGCTILWEVDMFQAGKYT